MELLVKVLEGIRQGAYPCLFRLATGAYCPGCGGTRAAAALLQGSVADSFRLNPLVPYLAAAVPVFFMYWFCCAMRRKKMRSTVWGTLLFAGIAVTVLNVLVKNYFLLVKGVDLLKGFEDYQVFWFN